MPISKADFKIDKQTSFRKGISLAAGLIMSKVKITNIETIFCRHSRHLLAGRIKIHVQVAAEDSSDAVSLTNMLTVENINFYIQEAEIISSPEVVFVSNGNYSVQEEDAKEKTNTSTTTVVIFCSAGMLLVYAAILLKRRKTRRQQETVSLIGVGFTESLLSQQENGCL